MRHPTPLPTNRAVNNGQEEYKTGVDVGWEEQRPTPRLQEAHMVIYHILYELVEAAMAEA